MPAVGTDCQHSGLVRLLSEEADPSLQRTADTDGTSNDHGDAATELGA